MHHARARQTLAQSLRKFKGDDLPSGPRRAYEKRERIRLADRFPNRRGYRIRRDFASARTRVSRTFASFAGPRSVARSDRKGRRSARVDADRYAVFHES
jgi:hypothetical protein